jgi:hypothetical protein
MTCERTLSLALHDPPPTRARLPERAMRDAVLDAAARTRADGLDRAVLFDARRRRFVVDAWPCDERPGLSVVADITTE